MSQQVKSAALIRIASIAPQHISHKLRVAGRVLAYDTDTTLLLIADGDTALFVNISLCLNPSQPMPWLSEANSIVTVLGYLEELQDPLPLPALPRHARTTEVDPHLLLSALLITESAGLDLAVWNHAIAEREKSR